MIQKSHHAFKKINSTGGACFIGSNQAEVVSKQHISTVIDDLSTGRMENTAHIKNVDFNKRTITYLGLLNHAFADAECIFHLAVLPSVQRSADDPLASNDPNVTGTLNGFGERIEGGWISKRIEKATKDAQSPG